MMPDGPLDQNGEAGLMTSFETKAMAEDMNLLGFPMLHAQVTSTVPQANLAAILSIVDENGRATLVSYGVLNLTHRHSHAEPEPMPAGKAEAISLQLNACGQHVPKGHRLRLSLATSYWPVIWPSQSAATLHLEGACLELPVRQPRTADSGLPPFQPPESATPLESRVHAQGSFERTGTVDFVTGKHIHHRVSDTGRETHLHTGMTVHYKSSEYFEIHPDDPNSAFGRMNWLKSYARDGWMAEVETEVSVAALRDCWRINARLVARDAGGEVIQREWSEDVPRDLV